MRHHRSSACWPASPGAATTLLLHAVEHLTYHYSFGTLLTGVGDSSPVRRAVGPMIGGALAGFRLVDAAAPTATFRRWPRRSPSIARSPGCRCRSTPAFRCCSSDPARRWAAKARRANSPRALGDFGTTRLALTARDREILLACAAGCRTWRGVQRAPWRRVVRGAHPARHLASPRGRDGVDHVEPRGRGGLAGHPLRARADVARREAVLPVRRSWRWPSHRWRSRSGLAFNQRDVASRDRKPQIQVVDADSRDRGRRAADRHLLDLVAGTAGQRQKHPDGEPQQRADAGRGGGDPAVETASDSVVPACGRGRRHAHARPGDGRGDRIGRRTCAQSPGRYGHPRLGGVADVCGRACWRSRSGRRCSRRCSCGSSPSRRIGC